MSKKQKELEAELQENESKAQDQISEGVVAKSEPKAEKKSKNAKDNKDGKKNKKKKEKTGGLVKKTKETASELKKVKWPSFSEVVKKTGVVVAFVLLFGIFIFGVNTLLGWLVGLLAG